MPEGYVVDTDVVSYLYRQDSRAADYRPYLEEAIPFISFMTAAELDRWTLHRNWGPRRRLDFSDFIDRFTVVMSDRALCHTWAEVADQARRSGRPIQVADAWIAATAVSLNAPLLTNNRNDFLGVDGLIILPDAAP